MTNDAIILGVESTCDETSLAIVKNGTEILWEITISQVKKHAKYGGVVPELAAREHINNIKKLTPKLKEQLKRYKPTHIAVASKIGLPPAVKIGESFALGISKALKIPLIEVNHVNAHVWGVFVDPAFIEKPKFPFIGLIMSGGHTQLVLFNSATDRKLLGETIDDAIGEAFDKVAKMLGLTYPGGPKIEKLAFKGDEFTYKLPIPLQDDSFNFSFAGLKTAVKRLIDKELKNSPTYMQDYIKSDIAASFQYIAGLHIAQKTKKALSKYNISTLVLGGGVSANQRILDLIYQQTITEKPKIFAPNLKYCGDNASLIAGWAYNFV